MPNSEYMKRVPISIGTLHIERCLELSKGKNLGDFSKPWQRALFSKHILKLQKLKEPKFDLNNVKGGVKVTKTITLKPFETKHISALCQVKNHKKRINIMLERTKNQ